MAFNPDVKRKIVRDKEGNRVPCVMCGVRYPLPGAVHIVDEKEWKAVHSCDRQINRGRSRAFTLEHDTSAVGDWVSE
jgi:hypothetical protein